MARSRNYISTINNCEAMVLFDKVTADERVKFAVGQEEVGQQGTHHLQLFTNWKDAITLGAIKKVMPTGHHEIARDVQASIEYCQKEDTRVLGPWIYGTPPTVRQKDNWDITVAKAKEMSEEQLQQLNPGLYCLVKKALSLIPQEPYPHGDVRGEWYFGLPGTGKSRTAYTKYPLAYRKAQNKWFCGYIGQDTIIMDDLDKLGGEMLGHYLKIWADRYPCTGEQKSLHPVQLRHHRFIVTSNYLPEDLWPQDTQLVEAIRRRFKFTEFKMLRAVDNT